MKKILILGAKGFLGKNLAEYFSSKEHYETIALSRSEVDFSDAEKLEEKVKNISPGVQFKCLATFFLAFSTIERETLPKECIEDGLPNPSCKIGNITSITSLSIGVVAALSK